MKSESTATLPATSVLTHGAPLYAFPPPARPPHANAPTTTAPHETTTTGSQWDRIPVRDGRRVCFLRPAEIDSLESEGNYVRLHLGGTRLLHRATLATLQAQLASHGFVRVSRFSLVNLDRIREWRPRSHGDSTLVLTDGREVAVTRTHRAALDQRLHLGRSRRT